MASKSWSPSDGITRSTFPSVSSSTTEEGWSVTANSVLLSGFHVRPERPPCIPVISFSAVSCHSVSCGYQDSGKHRVSTPAAIRRMAVSSAAFWLHKYLNIVVVKVMFSVTGRPDFTSCPTADKPEHGQDAGQKAGDKDAGQQQENQRAERGYLRPVWCLYHQSASGLPASSFRTTAA